MTKEEIKQSYSMRYIAEQYGYKVNRAGFVSCPFHNEKTASMKIYKDSFHCFGCGASGDIFTFVSHINNCSFKEAFVMLGGIYEKPTFASNLAIYRHNKKKEELRIKNDKIEKEKEVNITLIDVYRHYMKISEPMSEAWCDCYNALQYQLYIHENLNKKEVLA
ncbi:MAG: CHC2 zinc finger domain-containing protein [Eubacteriales bacterium]